MKFYIYFLLFLAHSHAYFLPVDEIGEKASNQTLVVHNVRKRQAIGEGAVRWDRKIPYSIEITSRTADVKTAFSMWFSYSCFTFYESSSDTPRMSVYHGDGPASHVGKTTEEGGLHRVSITTDTVVGSIAHEIGHALGFTHAQQRGDRDKHINVAKSRIEQSNWYNFNRESGAETYGVPVKIDDFETKN